MKKTDFFLFQNLLEKELQLTSDTSLIVGVSAGADSTALLHLLAHAKLGLKLYPVYIDHGLRPDEIPHEKEFLQNLCTKLGLDFRFVQVDVKGYQRNNKCSPEDAARTLRYQALETLRQDLNAHYIAVAHTSDDQVEEFFLRLLRGTGRKGLSGMAYKHDKIIRPLLHFSKAQLLSYLQEQGIGHCEDSSNGETLYLRNKVRLELLPALEQWNPSLKKTVQNTSHILADEEEFLEEIAQTTFMDLCRSHDNGRLEIDCPRFLTQHRAIGRRILEKAFWQAASTPSFSLICAVEDLAKGENGRSLDAPGLTISKKNDCLFFSPKRQDANTEGFSFPIVQSGSYPFEHLGKTLTISFSENVCENSLCLDADCISLPLELRYHHEGETFHPFGAPGKKKISRFLTDRKIHGEDKKLYPVLAHGTEVLAILGLCINEHYRYSETTTKFLCITWK